MILLHYDLFNLEDSEEIYSKIINVFENNSKDMKIKYKSNAKPWFKYEIDPGHLQNEKYCFKKDTTPKALSKTITVVLLWCSCLSQG